MNNDNFTLDITVPPADYVENIIDIDSFKILDNIENVKLLEKQIAYLRTSYSGSILFRGLADNKFKLTPSIIYNSSHKEGNICTGYYNILKKALQKLKVFGIQNEWNKYKLKKEDEELFYLSIGRHLGLNCQIMDWTSNFCTALSFAICDENKKEKNGSLWILFSDSNTKCISPFSVHDDSIQIIKESFLLPKNDSFNNLPKGILRRSRQNGYFTIVAEKNINKPIHILSNKDKSIHFYKIEISHELKKELYDKLINIYKSFILTEDNFHNELYNFIKELNREIDNDINQL